MTNRYQTLDVSVSLNNNSSMVKESPKRLNNTIDFGDRTQGSNIAENDERVNKFRELYFKNEKLRQELKLLNVKLNEKLQKVKLMPSKKKKSMSVDLNVQKPSKALQRQLQNAYNQVAMYKKQIATLKIKQQSQSTYEKYKSLQNQISYKDIEINQVEAELKAIKNVKKMQEKTLVHELQNEDLKDKLNQYERQFKQGQEKLKQIAKKARKREQEYKKQQAYQVALKEKLRKVLEGQDEEEQQQDQLVGSSAQNPYPNNPYNSKSPNMQSNQQQMPLTQQDFAAAKQQLQKLKSDHQAYQKKLQIQKKTIRDLKKSKNQSQERTKQIDIQIKGLMLKVQSWRRLIKDGQKKGLMEGTGFTTTLKNDKSPKKGSLTARQSSLGKLDEIDLQSEEPLSEQDENQKEPSFKQPLNVSQAPTTLKNAIKQQPWNGKTRKAALGQMSPTDSLHNITGNFRGLKTYIDQSQGICGLSFVYKQNGADKQTGVIGSRGGQQAWSLQPNDNLGYVEASMTAEGYLTQITLVSKTNQGVKLGVTEGKTKLNFMAQPTEQVTGFYCAVRTVGKDTRITEIGFWLTKSQ